MPHQDIVVGVGRCKGIRASLVGIKVALHYDGDVLTVESFVAGERACGHTWPTPSRGIIDILNDVVPAVVVGAEHRGVHSTVVDVVEDIRTRILVVS